MIITDNVGSSHPEANHEYTTPAMACGELGSSLVAGISKYTDWNNAPVPRQILQLAKSVSILLIATLLEENISATMVQKHLTEIPPRAGLWLAAANMESQGGPTEMQSALVLKKLLQRLAYAEDITRLYLIRNGEEVTSINALKLCWLDVAVSLMKALNLERTLMPNVASASREREAAFLQTLLFDICEGRRPQLSMDDVGLLKHQEERRRHTRRQTKIAVTIWLRNQAVRAQLIDASYHGCQVEADIKTSRGEYLIIQMPCGRQLEAQVCWMSSTSFGLRFCSNWPFGNPPVFDGV